MTAIVAKGALIISLLATVRQEFPIVVVVVVVGVVAAGEGVVGVEEVVVVVAVVFLVGVVVVVVKRNTCRVPSTGDTPLNRSNFERTPRPKP